MALALATDVVAIARLFLHVREAQSTGQNRGLRVEAIQHWSGGQAADSWCVEYVWMVLDLRYAGHPPFDRMQNCEAVRAWAADQGRLRTEPAAGDLFFYLDPSTGRAHHIGIVTGVNPLIGIAGNTSSDGKSANGDRVAEHAIKAKLFVRLP